MNTTPKPRNPIARAVRTPLFRQRVVRSKKAYDRKRDKADTREAR